MATPGDGGAASPPESPARGRPVGRRLAVLAAGLALLTLLSPLLGPVAIPAATVWRTLLAGATGGLLGGPACPGIAAASPLCTAYQEIVWQVRVPEVLLALIAGGALGLSGATLQGVFRNPLADPFLLGLSSGGTLGAAIVLVLHVGEAELPLVLPLLAFVGASATGLVILGVARSRYASVETLLLTGVALSNLLSAILTLLLLYNPFSSQQVEFWLLGGIGGASWTADGIAFGALLVVGTGVALHGRELNLLQLGSEVAETVGVDARRVRLRLILGASILTAVAVAFTGIIGFVGLVSPHIVRRLVGPSYRRVLPVSAVTGAVFLLGAHDISLLAFPSSVLPIGIFTAFAGVPFFLVLLYRQHRRTVGAGGAP